MVVVQPEERNMYDQHWQISVLREKYPLKYLVHFRFCILCFVPRKKRCCSSLASEHAQYCNHQEDFGRSRKGRACTRGRNPCCVSDCLHHGCYMLFLNEKYVTSLCCCSGGQAVAVVYFRSGYSPTDYPSESVSNNLLALPIFSLRIF